MRGAFYNPFFLRAAGAEAASLCHRHSLAPANGRALPKEKSRGARPRQTKNATKNAPHESHQTQASIVIYETQPTPRLVHGYATRGSGPPCRSGRGRPGTIDPGPARGLRHGHRKPCAATNTNPPPHVCCKNTPPLFRASARTSRKLLERGRFFFRWPINITCTAVAVLEIITIHMLTAAPALQCLLEPGASPMPTPPTRNA